MSSKSTTQTAELRHKCQHAAVLKFSRLIQPACVTVVECYLVIFLQASLWDRKLLLKICNKQLKDHLKPTILQPPVLVFVLVSCIFGKLWMFMKMSRKFHQLWMWRWLSLIHRLELVLGRGSSGVSCEYPDGTHAWDVGVANLGYAWKMKYSNSTANTYSTTPLLL